MGPKLLQILYLVCFSQLMKSHPGILVSLLDFPLVFREILSHQLEDEVLGPIITKIKWERVKSFTSYPRECCAVKRKGRVPKIVLPSRLMPMVFKYFHNFPVGGRAWTGTLRPELSHVTFAVWVSQRKRLNYDYYLLKWRAGRWRSYSSTMWDLSHVASQGIPSY